LLELILKYVSLYWKPADVKPMWPSVRILMRRQIFFPLPNPQIWHAAVGNKISTPRFFEFHLGVKTRVWWIFQWSIAKDLWFSIHTFWHLFADFLKEFDKILGRPNKIIRRILFERWNNVSFTLLLWWNSEKSGLNGLVRWNGFLWLWAQEHHLLTGLLPGANDHAFYQRYSFMWILLLGYIKKNCGLYAALRIWIRKDPKLLPSRIRIRNKLISRIRIHIRNYHWGSGL